MSTAIIIVGVGQWEEYTKPLVKSIKKYEPDVDVIVVDNGNRIPSEEKIISNIDFVVMNDVVNYATAINLGVQHFHVFGRHRWYLIMNNDVICDGPFVDYVNSLNSGTLYGNKVHNRNHKKFTSPTHFIDGWIYAIPRNAIDDVGYWDKEFKIAGFEDADYCIRAYKKGFNIVQSNLPFTHLEEHVRTTFDNYKKHRLDNMEYLITKHNLERK